MKLLLGFSVLTLCLVGCVSTTRITNTDAYSEINGQGRDRRAEVTVVVNSTDTTYLGDFVSVRVDSVFWLDPDILMIRSASVINLRRIRFINRLTGGLEGFLFGVAPGAIWLPFSFASGGPGNPSFEPGFAFVTALGGALIGTTTGLILGHKTDYEFNGAPIDEFGFPK